MRQVAGLIPTYSSDEFGICSALYELGGMVVMHDASGCNSTYTTHDEPRWYDMDSMIFISAISEMEAIMGDDDKLIGDLIETAEQLQPEFIAIVGAPIPYMIGTDLEAIAMVVEQETGICTMGFSANGMHDYSKGISMAFDMVVQRFCNEKMKKTVQPSVNIIGATPLDFADYDNIAFIEEWIRNCGFEINCCFAMGSQLDEIRQAGKAHVNLVISHGGLAAAKRLEQKYGTPYVVGVPVGKSYKDVLAKQLHDAYIDGVSRNVITKEKKTEKKQYVLIGESVFATSLATAIEMEYDIDVTVCVPVDHAPELLRDGDLSTPEEDDIMEAIKGADGLIADPFYQVLCDENMAFYPLPHEALSGRIFHKNQRKIKDMMK